MDTCHNIRIKSRHTLREGSQGHPVSIICTVLEPGELMPHNESKATPEIIPTLLGLKNKENTKSHGNLHEALATFITNYKSIISSLTDTGLGAPPERASTILPAVSWTASS